MNIDVFYGVFEVETHSNLAGISSDLVLIDNFRAPDLYQIQRDLIGCLFSSISELFKLYRL
jgi:hypothetical protein